MFKLSGRDKTTIYPCEISAESQASLWTSDCIRGTFPRALWFRVTREYPPGMTQTYYKAFAPRIGIAWDPGQWQDQHPRRLGDVLQPDRAVGAGTVQRRASFRSQYFSLEAIFNTPFVAQGGFATQSVQRHSESAARPASGLVATGPFCYLANFSPTCGPNIHPVQPHDPTRAESNLTASRLCRFTRSSLAGNDRFESGRLRKPASTSLLWLIWIRRMVFVWLPRNLWSVPGGQPVHGERSGWV